MFKNQYASASLGRYYNVHFLSNQSFFFLHRFLYLLQCWCFMQFNMHNFSKHYTKCWMGAMENKGGLAKTGHIIELGGDKSGPSSIFQVCVIPFLRRDSNAIFIPPLLSFPWVFYWKAFEFISYADFSPYVKV